MARNIKDLFQASKTQQNTFHLLQLFQPVISKEIFGQSIKQYKENLLSGIYDYVRSLITKYKKGYQNTGSAIYAAKIGFLGASGEHLWQEQINREIERNISNLDLILDQQLRETDKGKDLMRIIESYSLLRKQQSSSKKTGKIEIDISGPLLKIVQVQTDYYELQVNVSQELEHQIIELRNTIKMKSFASSNLGNQYYFQRNCWPVYQFIKILQETVRIWNKSSRILDENLSLLLSSQIQDISKFIEQGTIIQWTDRDKMDSEFGLYFETFY